MNLSPKTRYPRHSVRSHAALSRALRMEPLEDRRLLTSQAVEAVNLFAADVYEHMQRENGNLLFSPLSIVTALAMTYAGAGGQTASEMEHVLHIDPGPDIHDSFDSLLTTFEDQSNTIPNFEITLANAIWPQIGSQLEQSYLDTIQSSYRGHAEGVDYSNTPTAEQIINEWVEEQTHGRIKDLVTGLLSPDTIMVLTNSLYFEALWNRPFDPEYTHQGTFTLQDGSTVQTPMMLTHAWGHRTWLDGFRVLDLPFEGGASSMVIIVPTDFANPAPVTPALLSAIDEWFASPDFSTSFDTIEVRLPKFKSSVSTDLKPVLAGLGMPSAFEAGADFSGIFGADGIFIDDVIHKADIEVTEQGTIAAAATAIEFAICFAKGTLVLTPGGTTPIEQLRAGDQVLARSESNLEGPVEPQLVEEVFQNLANTLELHVTGRVIRATESHPFFAYKKGWTPARELQVGDRLATDELDWLEVERVVETNVCEPVYNLRVATHHTYFIGSKTASGGIWVHNSCVSQFYINSPFHYMIRDNTTGTISFLGRLDDPTQVENNLSPTVVEVAVNADFNDNQLVDGGDFLAWQRNFGMNTGATHTHGDSDADGDVDAGDLANWSSRYGEPMAGPLRAVTAELVDAALALEWISPDAAADFNATFAEESVSAETSPSRTVAEPSRSVHRSVRSEFRTDVRSETESTEASGLSEKLLERAFQTLPYSGLRRNTVTQRYHQTV